MFDFIEKIHACAVFMLRSYVVVNYCLTAYYIFGNENIAPVHQYLLLLLLLLG